MYKITPVTIKAYAPSFKSNDSKAKPAEGKNNATIVTFINENDTSGSMYRILKSGEDTRKYARIIRNTQDAFEKVNHYTKEMKKQGFEVSHVLLQEGKDPEDVIRLARIEVQYGSDSDKYKAAVKKFSAEKEKPEEKPKTPVIKDEADKKPETVPQKPKETNPFSAAEAPKEPQQEKWLTPAERRQKEWLEKKEEGLPPLITTLLASGNRLLRKDAIDKDVHKVSEYIAKLLAKDVAREGRIQYETLESIEKITKGLAEKNIIKTNQSFAVVTRTGYNVHFSVGIQEPRRQGLPSKTVSMLKVEDTDGVEVFSRKNEVKYSIEMGKIVQFRPKEAPEEEFEGKSPSLLERIRNIFTGKDE